ncbi:hypothetical protein BAOM_p028 (plasmid) [Peribacillus asahii]|uniref:Uncharacterized protein n=1 Tax=Peribacillus asahii TaxID=228899 RepID=A0A3T0KZD6_9BACI|nr:hypothetical protein [Peribacillus asahii]AZV45681.1 hypothetical protein BAOM_p028 [Peribacillus asahii]
MDLHVHLHDRYILREEEQIIDEQTKTQIHEALISFISQLVDIGELLIENLKHIYVTNNYTEELEAFQTKHGLNVGHTKNEIGEGFAMTLSYINEDAGEEQAIFLRAEVLFGLFNEEVQEGNRLSKNLLYHELAHVSDHLHQKRMFDKNEFRDLDLLPAILYDLSLHIWQEYYAYRKAATLFPSSDFQLDSFGETLDWFYDRSKQYIKNCNGDYDYLMKNMYGDAGYLFRTAASIHGNLQGFQIDDLRKQEMLGSIITIFANNYWVDIFEELGIELINLYNTYPRWQGYEQLEKLNQIVIKTFNRLGVFPQEAGSRIFVELK